MTQGGPGPAASAPTVAPTTTGAANAQAKQVSTGVPEGAPIPTGSGSAPQPENNGQSSGTAQVQQTENGQQPGQENGEQGQGPSTTTPEDPAAGKDKAQAAATAAETARDQAAAAGATPGEAALEGLQALAHQMKELKATPEGQAKLQELSDALDKSSFAQREEVTNLWNQLKQDRLQELIDQQDAKLPPAKKEELARTQLEAEATDLKLLAAVTVAAQELPKLADGNSPEAQALLNDPFFKEMFKTFPEKLMDQLMQNVDGLDEVTKAVQGAHTPEQAAEAANTVKKWTERFKWKNMSPLWRALLILFLVQLALSTPLALVVFAGGGLLAAPVFGGVFAGLAAVHGVAAGAVQAGLLLGALPKGVIGAAVKGSEVVEKVRTKIAPKTVSGYNYSEKDGHGGHGKTQAEKNAEAAQVQVVSTPPPAEQSKPAATVQRAPGTGTSGGGTTA